MFRLETISPKMLDYYVDNPRTLIVDLREEEDYRKSHIRGAVNIPYEEDMDFSVFPEQKELVLYCTRGTVSLLAGRELAKRGSKVRSVIGGFHAYKGRNLVFSSRG